MIVAFQASVPEGERRWIGRLVRRFLRVCGLDAWEIRVRFKRFRGRQLAQCDVEAMSTRAWLTFHPARLADRAALQTDVIHELWHLLDEELRDTLADMAAHIPDEKKRKRAMGRANRRYESWHDRTARVIGRLL